MASSAPSTTSASLPFDNTHKLVKHKNLVPYVYNAPSAEDLEQAHRVGNFPSRPSNLFLKAYSDVMQSVAAHPGADIVSSDLIATSGTIPLTINAPYDSLLGHYHDSIVSAEREILFAAGFWKVGKATTLITNAFRELNNRIAARGGPKVLIKIMWYRGAPRWRKKNTPKQKQKLTLPTPTECPFLDFETMDMHQLPLGVFHVKFIIIDKKFMLISSTNIQGKPNVELSVHTEGRIVDSFYSVFRQQWSKDFVPPLTLDNVPAPIRSNFDFVGNPIRSPCIYHSEHEDAPMFLANKLPQRGFGRRHWDSPQNIAWLSLMHNATRSIVIQTPDFNAGLAITAVLEACKRGVHVTILLSWVYNALKERFFQGGTNVHVIKGMYKKLMKMGFHQNLTVCFYVARSQFHPTKVHPNHTKFMAVDDTVAIFGSGNMDTQSWHHSMETNIAVDSPLLVKEWLDLFKISQNTHLYGTIDPNLAESPIQQIRHMLAKNNTQPTHVGPVLTLPPYINNSQLPIHTESEFRSDAQPHNNNFATQSALPNGQMPINSVPLGNNFATQSALPNSQLPIRSESDFRPSALSYNNNLATQSALPNTQLPINSASEFHSETAPNGLLPTHAQNGNAPHATYNQGDNLQMSGNGVRAPANNSAPLTGNEIPTQNNYAQNNTAQNNISQNNYAQNEITQTNNAQNNMGKEIIPPTIPTTGYPSS